MGHVLNTLKGYCQSRPRPSSLAPVLRRRAFSVIEVIVLIGSVVFVTQFGGAVHRWMWTQADLLRYRSTMAELTEVLRAMRQRAVGTHQTAQLRIDARRGGLQVVIIQERRGGRVERVERSLWLPKGLQITDAPDVVTSWPSGTFSPSAILVTAPSYQRAFRLTTTGRGEVRLDEEPTS